VIGVRVVPVSGGGDSANVASVGEQVKLEAASSGRFRKIEDTNVAASGQWWYSEHSCRGTLNNVGITSSERSSDTDSLILQVEGS
jgi:hypothetical protein